MVDCERCADPLPEGRRRGLCEGCRQLCPRCGQATGRNSPGYCAQCQRQRREQQGPQPGAPTRRRGQTFIPEPGLKADQAWFKNFVEQRLPVQQITLDVERSVDVTRTFYRREEFLAFARGVLGRLEPEEVRQLIEETGTGRK